MIKVGLTGGIGSGKSTVARLLADRGALIVDADALARDAVAPGSEGLQRVVQRFGPTVLARDGSLDRARLAALVFTDDAARRDLEGIVHPYVRARTAELVAAAPPGTVVVNDVPLLVEKQLQGGFDLVVVVDVDPAVQQARLRDRGMSEGDIGARIASQASREQRLAVADEVLDNNGDLAALERQVETLWSRLLAAAGEST